MPIDAYMHGGGLAHNKTIGGTSVEIFPANKYRRFLVIFNTHASAIVYLTLNATGPAHLNMGIVIGPGGFYQWNETNMYGGAIFAISDTAGVVCPFQVGE